MGDVQQRAKILNEGTNEMTTLKITILALILAGFSACVNSEACGPVESEPVITIVVVNI